MANTVGEVSYRVTIDTSQMKQGVTTVKSELDNMEKETEKSSGAFDKLKGGLATAGKVAGVAFGAMAGATVAIGKGALDAYADYEQLTGGMETLFKDSSGTMIEYANNAYKTAGVSANEYMQTVTSFSASLISSLGGDTAKSAEYANNAMVDMADNANKMGTSMEMIQNAYRGFAKQNYTMLDNLQLGYGGTKEEMERLLKKAQELTGVKYDINNFADITQAIHAVQTDLGITGTTAIEASETISGSFGAMKSAWQNVLTSLGSGSDKEVEKAINGLIESFGNVAKNLQKILPNIIQGFVQLVNALVPMLPSLIQQLLPPIIEGAILLFEGLVQALPEIIQALTDSAPTFVDAVIRIVGVIIENLPAILGALIMLAIQLIGSIFTRIGQLLSDWLSPIFEFIGNSFESFGVSVKIAINNIGKWFKEVFEGIGNFFGGLIQGMIDAFTRFFDGFKKGAQAVGEFFKNVWNGIKNFITGVITTISTSVANIFKGAVNGVLSFIENFINGPINIINGFLDVINGAFGAVGVNVGHISNVSLPRLASGGIVESRTGGSVIMAGEAGEDEWVVPESKMSSMLSQLQADGFAGGVTINIQGTFATSADEQRKVAEQIYDRLTEIRKSRLGANI